MIDKTVFKLTHEVPKERRAAIGEVCVRWSMLEHAVEHVIWTLRGDSRKAGRKITHNMFIGPRLKLMKQLARKNLPANEAHELVDLAGKIKNQSLERNLAVHGLYGRTKPPERARRLYAITYWKSPDGKAVEMPLTKLTTVAEDISRLHRQLWRFRNPQI